MKKKNKGRQERVYTTGDHCDNNCELHMYNPALARDLCGNIAAAALFYHLAYNIKSRLANGETDKNGVPWVKTSYPGILRFMTELTSVDQVKNLINILVEQKLIIKVGSNLKNAYTLAPMGYAYAKDRQTLGDKIPTMEAIKKSIKDAEVKKFVKTNDPRIKAIIDHFNFIAGEGRFKMGKTNTNLVATLLTEGRTVDEINDVVDYKYRELVDTKHANWIRPSTILGKAFDIWFRQMQDDPDFSKAEARRRQCEREPIRKPIYLTDDEKKELERFLDAIVKDYRATHDAPDKVDGDCDGDSWELPFN